MLLGDGAGSFDQVWPNQSGLIVSEDARGLSSCDWNNDGWVDFVVSVNNGKMKLFENNPDPSNELNSLKVRLSYAQGNPNGVGSKVSVIMEDGTVQSDEVSAGGSYLSQSSPDLFFGVGLEKKIKSINVRWPDGKETVNEYKKGENIINISRNAN